MYVVVQYSAMAKIKFSCKITNSPVPVCPWSEERHRQVEESSVGGCVAHVWAKVDCRGVDLGVGRDVGHSGEEVVHHARVVGVVDGRTVEPKQRIIIGLVVRPAERLYLVLYLDCKM